MSNITNNSPIVTEQKLTEFYEDIKPFLGCPAYITQEGDEMYFSTDEKVIGRWTNGKPLYQKTYSCGALPNNNGKTIDSGIDNIERCIYIWGCAFSPSTNNMCTLPYVHSTGLSNQILLDFRANKNIYINTTGNKSSYTESYVTIQYTNTTDSATTKIEEKPTHYSTDEQVVGTWIDGKPVYQRTWELTNVTVGANTETDITVDDSTNIKKIINAYGTYGDDDPFPFYTSVFSVRALKKNSTNKLAIRCIRSGSAFTTNFTVTFQYTKTTD